VRARRFFVRDPNGVVVNAIGHSELKQESRSLGAERGLA